MEAETVIENIQTDAAETAATQAVVATAESTAVITAEVSAVAEAVEEHRQESEERHEQILEEQEWTIQRLAELSMNLQTTQTAIQAQMTALQAQMTAVQTTLESMGTRQSIQAPPEPEAVVEVVEPAASVEDRPAVETAPPEPKRRKVRVI